MQHSINYTCCFNRISPEPRFFDSIIDRQYFHTSCKIAINYSLVSFKSIDCFKVHSSIDPLELYQVISSVFVAIRNFPYQNDDNRVVHIIDMIRNHVNNSIDSYFMASLF